MFVHFKKKNVLLFYNPNNKTLVFPYRSANANTLSMIALLYLANICALTQGHILFCLHDVFLFVPAEMGLFHTTQFPGNRTPISLQVRCLW